ncbi:MAG: hypothetical protein AB8H79_15905 [Myxococcota bacterium]
MTRSIVALTALTLAAAIPAFAGLLSSPMSAVVAYPGNAQDLSADFVLYDAGGSELFRHPAAMSGAGNDIEVGAPISQTPFSHLSDTEWCLEIDATNANGSVVIDYFSQQDANHEDRTWGDGQNIAGSVGELCGDATIVK